VDLGGETAHKVKIGKKETPQVEEYAISVANDERSRLMVTELSLLPVESASEFP
jgi:hypothetical protein